MARVAASFDIETKDTEQRLQRVDRLMKLLNKTSKELKAELSDVFVSPAGELDKYDENLNKGGKSLKTFRTEQRTTNFIVREGTQALTSAVFAVSLLARGQDTASSSTKRMTTALLTGVTAMNSAEFAMFGIGQMGQKIQGPLGTLAGKISQNAGVIGLVIGLGAAFVSFLNESGESAEEAAKRLERYNQAAKDFVEGLSKEQAQRAFQITQANITLLKEEARLKEESLKADRAALSLKGIRGDATEAEVKAVKRKQEDLDLFNQTIAAHQRNSDALRNYLAAIEQVEAVERRRKGSRTEEVKVIMEQHKAVLLLGKAWQDVVRSAIMADKSTRTAGLGPPKIELVPLMPMKTLAEQVSDELELAHRKQVQAVEELQNGFFVLSAGLDAVGVKSDSTIQKLIQGIQMVAEIAKTMSAINNGQIGGFAGGLGIFGNMMGLAGLGMKRFQSGGFTGHGSASQPAGLVDKGEFVFEKALVDRSRGELEMIRQMMKGGETIQSALRSLGGRQAGSPITIVVEGAMDGQRFFRKNASEYERFRRKKKL